MATKSYCYVWSVRWANPYTQPPDGRPEVLGSVTLGPFARGGAPRPPEALLKLHTPGDGYGLCCSHQNMVPRRELSLETKQKIRRQRLERRVRSKAPLFAEQLIAEEIQRRPEYFGVTNDLR